MKNLLSILIIFLILHSEVYGAVLRTGSGDSGTVIITVIIIIIVSIIKIFMDK